jgi:chemotaxis signal transduction protein
MTTEGEIEQKVAALRAAFDRSFAEAAGGGSVAYLDFLTIHVAGDAYALRLSEVQSLHVDRKLIVTPSLLPELTGMAWFRGALTPIYDLSALLGYGVTKAAQKWLVLVQHASPIGLAFEAFDAHVRVPPSSVSAPEPGANGAAFSAIRSGAATLPILHLPSIVAGIAQRIQALGPSQER